MLLLWVRRRRRHKPVSGARKCCFSPLPGCDSLHLCSSHSTTGIIIHYHKYPLRLRKSLSYLQDINMKCNISYRICIYRPIVVEWTARNWLIAPWHGLESLFTILVPEIESTIGASSGKSAMCLKQIYNSNNQPFLFILLVSWCWSSRLESHREPYRVEVQSVNRIYLIAISVAFECEVFALLRIIQMMDTNSPLDWTNL